MEFKSGKDPFVCRLADDETLKCDPVRARWSNGYWADVCQAHMDRFRSNLNKKHREPWTGRPRAQEAK